MANERKDQRLWVCLAVAMGLCLTAYVLLAAPRVAYATTSIEVVYAGDVAENTVGESQDIDVLCQDGLSISLPFELPSNINMGSIDLNALQQALGKPDTWKDALAELTQQVTEITQGINVDELKPAAFQAIMQAVDKAKEAWTQSGQANAEDIQKVTEELNKVWDEVQTSGKRVSIESATVSGLKTQTYTGKALEPKPKVVLDKKTLVAGTDYAVIYANNTNAGKATAVIVGAGDYTGALTCDFTIKKAANTFKVKGKTAKVKCSKLKTRNQTLAVSKVLKYTKKGQGTKAFTKVSGNKKITINKKTGKVTIKKGLKKGTYKVRVRVRAKGDDNHNPSAKKTVTIKIRVV